MTRRHLVPFLLVAAGCTGSGEPPAGSASTPPSAPITVAAAPSPAGPLLVAEIVMIDSAAPSLTVREGDVPALKSPGPKDIKPTDRTIRVEPAAASSLAGLKPGQRVRLTCSGINAGSAPAAPAGAVSPAMTAASPAILAGASPMAAGAVPGDLSRCDSIVAVMPLESPAP